MLWQGQDALLEFHLLTDSLAHCASQICVWAFTFCHGHRKFTHCLRHCQTIVSSDVLFEVIPKKNWLNIRSVAVPGDIFLRLVVGGADHEQIIPSADERRNVDEVADRDSEECVRGEGAMASEQDIDHVLHLEKMVDLACARESFENLIEVRR